MLEVLASTIRQEKQTKVIQIKKEENKTVFVHVIYVENLKEAKEKKLPELINYSKITDYRLMYKS